MPFEDFFVFGSVLLIMIAPTIEAKVRKEKYALIGRRAVGRGLRNIQRDADI